ncbi:MAG: hypothetical protein KZQ94_19555 [Candidatus Thiodiazotropha sp. (ex Troendleina suluensis)]|nr:hypothetical protein [Candidatus Thiodiazotropha sp. (ex Troendleina suluensis)]
MLASFPMKFDSAGSIAAVVVWLAVSNCFVPVAADEGYWVLPIPAQGEAPADYHDLTRDISPFRCGLCHIKQFSEWAGSLHARASTKGLLGQLPAYDQEAQTACLNCHAPTSEQQEFLADSAPGQVQYLFGVDCASCHLRRHIRHGPRGKPVTPHGQVIQTELFEQSAFCSPCHQFPEWGERVNGKLLENTEQEWRRSSYAKEGIGCRECHMPNGSHAFKGIHDPEMTRKALRVEARRGKSGIVVDAWNAGAGHALPTYATPRIRILVQSDSPPESMLEHVIQRQLHWDVEQGWTEQSDTRLLPKRKIRLTLKLLPSQDGEVAVLVEPDAFYHEFVYPSLEVSIGGELDPDSRAMLQEAEVATGRTGYRLYGFQCPPWQGREERCIDRIPLSGGHRETK